MIQDLILIICVLVYLGCLVTFWFVIVVMCLVLLTCDVFHSCVVREMFCTLFSCYVVMFVS